MLKRLLTYIVIALSYLSMGAYNYVPQLEVYGRGMESRGDLSLVPFRYQGQYEDAETGLYYNRFRYYSPQMGMYISSDPIGLAGNNPTLYGYVSDTNIWIDILGLAGRMGLNYAKIWHDKRATDIFGEGAGRNVGGRFYDKSVDGLDIEFKSDNFSKGPRSEESLNRMNTQLEKDIKNKSSNKANPHWHFEHDPRKAPEMRSILRKMKKNGITWTHGKNYYSK